MPHSVMLSVTLLNEITLSKLGPYSSVSRMPSALPLTWLPLTVELETTERWMPPPQSPWYRHVEVVPPGPAKPLLSLDTLLPMMASLVSTGPPTSSEVG